VPAQDDDLPFVLTVEDAFRITGQGTVIMGVIEQDGVLRVGDYLELIQPGDAGTAAPLRCRCRSVDLAPRKTGRDPALGALVAIIVGPPWIEPDAIQAGAKLRAVAEISAETYSDRRRQRKADKLTHRVRHR
jgi:GTPase